MYCAWLFLVSLQLCFWTRKNVTLCYLGYEYTKNTIFIHHDFEFGWFEPVIGRLEFDFGKTQCYTIMPVSLAPSCLFLVIKSTSHLRKSFWQTMSHRQRFTWQNLSYPSSLKDSPAGDSLDKRQIQALFPYKSYHYVTFRRSYSRSLSAPERKQDHKRTLQDESQA